MRGGWGRRGGGVGVGVGVVGGGREGGDRTLARIACRTPGRSRQTGRFRDEASGKGRGRGAAHLRVLHVLCTGESRRRQRSDVRPVRACSPISAASSRLRRRQFGTSQDAQSQLRPRRVDGGTPRHLPSAPVHSAGSQLPLEGTERYLMAQMTKIKIV